MNPRKKLNVQVNAEFAGILSDAAERGKPAAEVTEMFAEAWLAAKDHRDEAAGSLLRAILGSPDSLFKAEDFLKIAQEPALGVHVGDPKRVYNCPFARTFVGIAAGEVRPHILAERTFAEWRVAQKTVRTRHTVIIYKAARPVAIYRDVTWGQSPDELLNGEPGRQNKGRHFIASAEVSFFGPGKTFTFETHKNEDGFIRFHLSNERTLDPQDPVLSYVGSHHRERKAVQQPLDMLDIG